MIYKVLCKSEIEELEATLKTKLPGTSKIFYVIRNVVLGYLNGFEVIVDNWPNFSCILLRPRSKSEVLSYFRFTHICHGTSVSALKYFLQRPGLINWSEPINFTGVPNDLIPALSEVCRKHGGVLQSKESRLMYAWSKCDPPCIPELPKNLKLASLKPEHATVMTEHWTQRGSREDLESYFRSVITNFDSSCLVDENDRLLAYVCMHFNGSMAMVYVRPEYRKEGYFHLLLRDLTHKILAKKDIAYGFIPVNDTSLIKLCREIGFEWVPQGNMTWSRYTPNTQKQNNSTVHQSNMTSNELNFDDLSTGVANLLLNTMVNM